MPPRQESDHVLGQVREIDSRQLGECRQQEEAFDLGAAPQQRQAGMGGLGQLVGRARPPEARDTTPDHLVLQPQGPHEQPGLLGTGGDRVQDAIGRLHVPAQPGRAELDQ
ncbi:hypothetical protein ACFQV8_19315 [Pseudonocardia benzenivorans]